jgi:hypothetical protein
VRAQGLLELGEPIVELGDEGILPLVQQIDLGARPDLAADRDDLAGLVVAGPEHHLDGAQRVTPPGRRLADQDDAGRGDLRPRDRPLVDHRLVALSADLHDRHRVVDGLPEAIEDLADAAVGDHGRVLQHVGDREQALVAEPGGDRLGRGAALGREVLQREGQGAQRVLRVVSLARAGSMP